MHSRIPSGEATPNRLLQSGWRLLHIYTLEYQEDVVWRERQMAILGRPMNNQQDEIRKKSGTPLG